MLLKIKLCSESVFLILVALSFFVGVWHGLPSLNTVNDEMYFVGGVFRALDAKTIIPQHNDVPYGTVNYLVSYVFICIVLILLFPWFGFNVMSLKIWVINNYFYFYLIPRFISVIASIGLLYFIYRLARENISNTWYRCSLIILLFGNILVADILRTGKMWVFTTFCVVAALYFFYKTISGNPKYVWWVIMFSAIAAGNFPLAAISLLLWPVLVYFFYRHGWSVRSLLLPMFVGFVLILLLCTLNYQGILMQITSIVNDYTLSDTARENNLGFFESLSLYLIKTVFFFAPIILVGLLSGFKVKNRYLFYISLSSLIIYLVFLAGVARWSVHIYSYMRYLFPVGFFLVIILISKGDIVGVVRKVAVGLIVSVTLLYFAFTLVYITRPTTFLEARHWIEQTINTKDITIISHVGMEVDLPINKQSALLIKDQFCASRCQAARDGLLQNNFLPVVITEQSNMPQTISSPTYHIYKESQTNTSLELVYYAKNPYHYGWAHSIETLGNYFDPTFFKLDNLGKNLYIYRQL